MYSPAIHSFSLAMVELAKERKIVPQVQTAAVELIEALKLPELSRFLAHPKTPVRLKQEVLQDLLPEDCPQELNNFIKLIIDRHREELLLPIMEALYDLTVESQGYEIIELISALPLVAAERNQMMQRLETAWKRKLFTKYRENPSLIGGVIIRRGDQLFDGSLKGQINTLKASLLEAAK